jgi:two-component system response regulator FixJ
MSGLDLQEQLRKNRINVPVILISGYADVKIAVQAMQQGAVTLLQKPYNQDDLLTSVRQGVSLNSELRERREKADAAKQLLAQLNAKEVEVLEQMLQGKSNKAVAQTLGIGLRTVERRRHDIFSKTNVDSEVKLAELVQQAELDEAFLGVK